MMSISADPFLSTSVVVQMHAAAATLALISGPVALYRRRRDVWHKAVGYTWVLAMAFAALSSFWIRDFAIMWGLSPIHLLSVLALWSLWVGMRYAFRGNIAAHRAALASLYWRGLLVAASFNFLPGRAVNRTFFSDDPEMGYIALAAGLALILGQAFYGRVRRNTGLAQAA